MADAKISQLPVATTPLAGTELVPVVQGGVTVQTTVGDVLTGAVPSGTANGVLYLNGSKVVTSGSALTFDGTNLRNTSGAFEGIDNMTLTALVSGTNATVLTLNSAGTSGITRFQINNSEAMRLTSTGLGIGTSSPVDPLTVNGTIASRTNINSTVNILGVNSNAGSSAQVRLRIATDTVTANYGVLSSGYAKPLLYLGTESNHPIAFLTNNTQRMELDSSGNLGLGVTPSAWSGPISVFEFGSKGGVAGAPSDVNFLYNTYYDGANKYRTTDFANNFQMAGGAFKWFTAPSGTAGNPISFTQALTLDANRNLLLNGTSAGASAVGTLAIFNGTAPTGSVTDGIILYAEDVSSSSELKVRDEAGNVTTLSPHNFSLIPEGPSEDMAWAYYSEKDGKRINVDMLKLARMVEKLTGEKLVYSA